MHKRLQKHSAVCAQAFISKAIFRISPTESMACSHFNFLGNFLPLQRPAFAGRCNLLCLRMAVRSRVKLGGLHDNLVEALGFLYTGHEATSHPHLFRDGLNCVLWECPMFLPLCPASKLRPWLSPARHAALRLIPSPLVLPKKQSFPLARGRKSPASKRAVS